MEKTITLFYKNGTSCSHTWDRPEEDWQTLIRNIGGEMIKTPRAGLLRLQGPFGLHDIEDITHFHVGDFDPPAGQRDMGFV